MKRIAVLLLTLAMGLSLAQSRVDDLLKRMTLEEKIGQLTQIGGLALMPDSLSPEERVRRGHAGSILWLSDPVAINKMQKIAVEDTRLHIPVIFALDVSPAARCGRNIGSPTAATSPRKTFSPSR